MIIKKKIYFSTIQFDINGIEVMIIFVKWPIDSIGLFNAESVFVEVWKTLFTVDMDKAIHTFPKCVCPKVNVIAPQVFELANYDVTALHVIHYIRG